MKLLFENWRKFTESSEDPELWGIVEWLQLL